MRVYVTIVEGYFMELSIGEGTNKKVTIDDGNFFLGSSIRGIISVITIAMVKPVLIDKTFRGGAYLLLALSRLYAYFG